MRFAESDTEHGDSRACVLSENKLLAEGEPEA